MTTVTPINIRLNLWGFIVISCCFDPKTYSDLSVCKGYIIDNYQAVLSKDSDIVPAD